MSTSNNKTADMFDNSSIGDGEPDVIRIDENVENNLGPIKGTMKRTKRLTSDVWKMFVKVSGTQYADSKDRARCKHCAQEFVHATLTEKACAMCTNTTTEDQRKRTTEALERRFATAKAEALQQVKHGKRRLLDDNEKRIPTQNPSAIASSLHVADGSIKNAPNALPKKGNFTFSGYAGLQGMEESGPTYSLLSESIHENLLTTNVEPCSRRGSAVNKVLHELFQNGDSAQKYLQGSRSMKIDNWILLDSFVQGRHQCHIKAVQTHSKRSRKHMSLKQLKKGGSLDLKKDLQKFEKYRPMHEMWKGYITQLLKTSGKNQLSHCLISADLHGAFILVAESKLIAFTGVSGIMIRETAETFGIVTQDDKFHVVPKKFCVFMFQVDCWKITLMGDKLTSRSLGV